MPEQQRSAQTVYQTATLTPNLINTLVRDDSPDLLYDKLWQFLGVDIPVAFIEPWDFENILDMVDVAFLDMMEQYPESEWDTVAIVEYSKVKTGKGFKMIPKNAYLLVDLWHAVSSKIYTKMCRARGGFTLKAITEQRSKIDQTIQDNRPLMVQPVGGSPQEKKSGWSVL